jgi:hypothetical protein
MKKQRKNQLARYAAASIEICGQGMIALFLLPAHELRSDNLRNVATDRDAP